MTERDRSFIIRLAALVLAIVVLAMVGTMLVGLFDIKVDNDKIFGILGPAFQMIIGCLVGVLGSMRGGYNDPPPSKTETQ